METGSFETTGLNIFYRYWPAREEHEGVILCIHGIAGDSRIFSYFAEKSSTLGHSVYAIDLPGFGRSDGEKGDVLFDTTLHCLHDVVKQISNRHGNGKLFLLGFSLGGLYSLYYASLHQEVLNGIILVAPHLRIKGVKRNPSREPAKATLLRSLIRYFISPRKKINIGRAVPNAFGELAGDEWVYMMNDALCNFDYSYRYIFDVLIGRAEKMGELYKIEIPLLILHGGRDVLPVPQQSQTFIERVQSVDKELKIVDGSDHWFYQTFFYKQRNYTDTERMGVIQYIDAWMRSRGKC